MFLELYRAADSPENRRDLAACCKALGDICKAGGDQEGAERYYQTVKALLQ